MIKSIFSKIGKGGAAVDLQLTGSTYVLGGTLEGQIVVRGGGVPQMIHSLSVNLLVEYEIKGLPSTKVMGSVSAAEQFVIDADEVITLPFIYPLPEDLPISCQSVSYSLCTCLELEDGTDVRDTETVTLKGTDAFLQIFYGLGALGFRESAESGEFNGSLQTFVFFPAVLMKEEIKEVHIQAGSENSGIRILLETYCREGVINRKEHFFLNEKLRNRQDVEDELKAKLAYMAKARNIS